MYVSRESTRAEQIEQTCGSRLELHGHGRLSYVGVSAQEADGSLVLTRSQRNGADAQRGCLPPPAMPPLVGGLFG